MQSRRVFAKRVMYVLRPTEHVIRQSFTNDGRHVNELNAPISILSERAFMWDSQITLEKTRQLTLQLGCDKLVDPKDHFTRKTRRSTAWPLYCTIVYKMLFPIRVHSSSRSYRGNNIFLGRLLYILTNILNSIYPQVLNCQIQRITNINNNQLEIS